jgi:hypothetical protein
MMWQPDDPRIEAGLRAEASVNHHLRKAFFGDDDVVILANLKFGENEEQTQIDHLVIHRHGMIVIETKSVGDAVRINDAGEWERYYKGRWMGFASPVAQAEAQVLNLRRHLRANVSKILKKLFGLFQTYFHFYQVDWLVAISEDGRIERTKTHPLPEVAKAEMMPDLVRRTITRQRRETSFFFESIGSVEGGKTAISKKEFQKAVSFLSTLQQTVLEPAPRLIAEARSEDPRIPMAKPSLVPKPFRPNRSPPSGSDRGAA